MGCEFDSVVIFCPVCQRRIILQSKAAHDACMRTFDLVNAPKSVLGDLHGREIGCVCGFNFRIGIKVEIEFEV